MRSVWVGTILLGLAFGAWAQGWAPHDPIYIHGDEGFTWENGVVKGAGTPEDPYIIEGWVIDTRGHDYGLYIDGTRAHFVVRNCQIRYPQERAGIFLSNVRNGRIENNAIFGGRIAVQILATQNVVITQNAIGFCDFGIVVDGASQGNMIFGNAFFNCSFPAKDEGLNNSWHHQGQGNYWSDYRGQDLNKDGIGDTPYELVPDAYPLMSPPVSLPPEAAPMRTVDLGKVDERGIVALAPGTLVRIVAQDVGVGVDKIFYRLDGTDFLVYTEPFPLPDKPMVRMEYYSVDKLGNREPTKTLTIYLDIHAPITRIIAGEPSYLAPDGKLWITSKTPIELRSEDASGVANIFYRLDGGDWRHYTGTFTVPGPEGPHKIEYYAIDAYGNREGVQSAVLWKDDSAPVTQPSVAGQ